MYKKIIHTSILISMMSIFSISSVYAEQKQIIIDPIFTQEQGNWYPGRVETKDFYITNNSKNTIEIDRLYIQLKSSRNLNTNEALNINSKQFKELSKNSIVKLIHKDKLLFKDKLENLLSENGIVLSQKISIKSNEKALLNMTIDMDEKMNNEAQYLENIFSIGVTYTVGTNPEPPGPPVEPDNPGPPISPGNPESPVDPDKPEPPINPGNPELPVDPDKPELPINPGNPDKPMNPSNPELPANPDTGIGGVDKLPQTGGMVNGTSLLAIGSIVVGTGIMLNKKSLGEKGGKHDE